jgi:hypothetical protein
MKALPKSVVATAALLLFAGSVNAAAPLGVMTYTYSAPSDSELEDEVEEHEIRLEGMVPVVSGHDGGVYFGLGTRLQANIWTFDDDRIEDVELYKLLLTSEFSVPVNETYAVAGGVQFGAHSDLEYIDEDDFRVEGHVMGVYAYSPTLRFALGVGFGDQFGDPQAFPVGGVYWRATDSLVLNLMIPKPRVTYAVSSDLRLFLAAEPAGGQWNVGEDDEDFDFELKGIRAGVGAEYQVVDGGWLFAMAGSESGRELQLAKDDEELFDDDVDLDDNVFVQVGFRLQ